MSLWNGSGAVLSLSEGFEDMDKATGCIRGCFEFYNEGRPHQVLNSLLLIKQILNTLICKKQHYDRGSNPILRN